MKALADRKGTRLSPKIGQMDCETSPILVRI